MNSLTKKALVLFLSLPLTLVAHSQSSPLQKGCSHGATAMRYKCNPDTTPGAQLEVECASNPPRQYGWACVTSIPTWYAYYGKLTKDICEQTGGTSKTTSKAKGDAYNSLICQYPSDLLKK